VEQAIQFETIVDGDVIRIPAQYRDAITPGVKGRHAGLPLQVLKFQQNQSKLAYTNTNLKQKKW
jgi:hypothetical protein